MTALSKKKRELPGIDSRNKPVEFSRKSKPKGGGEKTSTLGAGKWGGLERQRVPIGIGLKRGRRKMEQVKNSPKQMAKIRKNLWG